MTCVRNLVSAGVFLLLSVMAVSCSEDQKQERVNSNFMWFDCEANYERLSYPDSIRFYLQKCKDAGFDNVVVDVKSIMGEVLYDSRIAPYMGEWDGWYRRQDYDMLSYFIKYGHESGMKVYASLNIFAGGHNWYDRGIIYKEHPEWQSIVYDAGELKPISEIKSNYNGMLNPANPEVRQYQLDILDEFARKYKDLDGIIFDRVRYDGITSDFSDLSRQMFEEYAGVKVEKFPEDIIYWEKDPSSGELNYREGRYFRKWVEWRASVIKDFIRTHHGKGKTKYFYISYKNEHPDEQFDESVFTYPGPNPFSKETAILMMADSVEAASRSLKEYTDENIAKLVDGIIDTQVQEGFFNECPITFLDIENVKNVFKEKLKTMYHTRISYPKLKTGSEPEEKQDGQQKNIVNIANKNLFKRRRNV